nr:MAG TPA: hypothetical protein [Caudoviricetes sp.]
MRCGRSFRSIVHLPFGQSLCAFSRGFACPRRASSACPAHRLVWKVR